MRELFLTSFGVIQYGIWKDEILSVRDLDSLHRIPLSPACIAGIMIDDGRTVTLVDLPGCMGYEPSQGTGQGIDQGCILLMAEGEKVTGFVVSGEIRTQSIPPEMLFPIPDYLKTPVFDSCAIHDGIPIPIINIAELYLRVLKADAEFSVDSLGITTARPLDNSGMAGIRFIASGGELFAAFAAGMEDKTVKPGPITPLPNTPRYVKGVTFWKGRLLTVIDFSQRIKRQSGKPDSIMLIARIEDSVFGLLIDGDEGTLSSGEVTIKPAPLIAQNSWLRHVVVRAGELIPLVDLAMALSSGSGAVDEKPVWQRYTPGSQFPDLFFKHDVDVVEFSLLGERHALPKQEVGNVIAFKPCRALPDALPIVIGVAEHEGEILPVVDLAMMFGRRSVTTPAWRMMLVSNGDFRALVITETVYKERRLPLDIHRAVPIHLPHNLMYGCYPDAEVVRLILNVEAISVHFKKSLIQKFLPALSHEMKMMSTEAEPAHGVESAAALSPAEPEALAMQEQASVHQEVDEPVPELQQQADEKIVEAIEVQELVTAAPAFASEPEPELEPMDAELAAASSTKTQESLSSSGEWSEWDTKETLEQEQVQPAEAVSEKTMEPEPADKSVDSTGQEFIAAERNDSASVYSQAVPEFKQQAAIVDAEFVEWQEAVTEAPAIAPEPEPMDAVHAAATSARTQEAPSIADKISTDEAPEQKHVSSAAVASQKTIILETNTAAEETPLPNAPLHRVSAQQSSGQGKKAREPVGKSKQSPGGVLKEPSKKEPAKKVQATASEDSRTSEPIRPAASIKPSAPYRMSREVEQLSALSGHEERSADTEWKRRIAYGTIAIVLIAVLFYFAGTSEKSIMEKSVHEIEPVKIEPAKAETVPVKTKAEQAKAQAAQAKLEVEQAKAEREAKLKADQEAIAQAKEVWEAKLKAALEAKAQAKAERAKLKAEQAKAKTEQRLVLTKPSPSEKPRAPLELDIPATMPVDIDVYVVKKDDTLWSISERFTGNPFNYPRIAGENRIADPDLIFPGQRIRLKK